MNNDWILVAIPLAVLVSVLLAGWATKRLLFRSLLREEGIEIPFSTRTVHVQLKSKTGTSVSEGRKE